MTDIRKEFQELLTNYPCSDFQSDEQNYENVITKTEWLIKNIPNKLFRFRPCSKEYNCLIKNAKPTAIYLGTKISEENQTKLIEICKSKNLPCFKAFPNYFSSEYKYTFINVNELYNVQN